MTFDFTQFAGRDRMNDRLVREVLCTGPASYTTGGDNLDISASLGMGQVFGVYGTLSNGTNLLDVWWNFTTQRLLIFDVGNAAQVANGTNLSGYTGVLLITGR